MNKQKLIERLHEYGRQFTSPQLIEDMFYAAELIESSECKTDPIPLPTIKPKELLNQYQIAVIRTLWELAQGRIDALYTPVVAEGEKVAVEELMIRVYPESVWNEVVRAGSEAIPNE